MNEIVKVYYASGWKLQLPAEGLALRLFFEWMIIYQSEYKRPPSYRLFADTFGDAETPIFKLYFEHLGRNEADNLRDYLRLNLGC